MVFTCSLADQTDVRWLESDCTGCVAKRLPAKGLWYFQQRESLAAFPFVLKATSQLPVSSGMEIGVTDWDPGRGGGGEGEGEARGEEGAYESLPNTFLVRKVIDSQHHADFSMHGLQPTPRQSANPLGGSSPSSLNDDVARKSSAHNLEFGSQKGKPLGKTEFISNTKPPDVVGRLSWLLLDSRLVRGGSKQDCL